MFRKWHTGYGLLPLVSRALMLQFARLMPTASTAEKQLHRLNAQLGKLIRKNPDIRTGRHQLISSLFGHLRSPGGIHATRDVPININRIIVRRHAAVWAKYSMAQQLEYETRARRAAEGKRIAIMEEVEDTRSQRAVLVQQLEDEEAKVPPLLMSSAALCPRHLDHFSNLMSNNEFRGVARIKTLRAVALFAPKPVLTTQRLKVMCVEVWARPEPPMPEWARGVALQREHFQNTVLIVAQDSGEVDYRKFIYAVITPL